MTPPAPARTHIWDGTRTLPDWLTNHHWTAGQLVIHTPDGDTRPQAGWWLIGWTDGSITVASPRVAERVYGADGIAGRLARAEHELRRHADAEAADIAAGSYAGRVEELEAGFAQVRETNRRLNLRAQKLEAELAAYRRAVDQWEINERGTYIPHSSLRAIGLASGKDILGSVRHLRHFERVEQAEAVVGRVRAALASFDGRGVLSIGHVNLDVPTAGEVLTAVRAALDGEQPGPG